MAIVKEFVSSKGAVVRIHDDFYAEASPEEISRRIDEFKETARQILVEAEIRKLQE